MVVTSPGQTITTTADGALVIGEVTGGKETNPMIVSASYITVDNESFRQALYESLDYAGLFRKIHLEGKQDYRLEVEILGQEVKPGFDISSTVHVRYVLYKEKENNIIWSKNIFSQHESLSGEAFSGEKRAKLAIEGAVRDNISQLIVELVGLVEKMTAEQILKTKDNVAYPNEISNSTNQRIVGTWVSQTKTDSEFRITFSENGTFKISTRFEEFEGTYQADFSKKPAYLDMDFRQNGSGKTIVKFLDDGRLVMADNNPGEPRPQSFSSDAVEFTRSTESAVSKPDIEIVSASKYVVVDQSEPAFIVFTGIPVDIDNAQLEEIKLKVANREALTMLPWQQFLEKVDEYSQLVILRDDYPTIKTLNGIVCLIASKQGTGAPWGLTWNGGIALSYNDYQHVRRTYESFNAAPASYQPIQDPRRDPVHPRGHLPFGGCY
jgi:hypothetical protein